MSRKYDEELKKRLVKMVVVEGRRREYQEGTPLAGMPSFLYYSIIQPLFGQIPL